MRFDVSRSILRSRLEPVLTYDGSSLPRQGAGRIKNWKLQPPANQRKLVDASRGVVASHGCTLS